MKQKTIRISPEYTDIDEIIEQYHFSEDDRPRIKSLYQKHFSSPAAQITYETAPIIPSIHLDKYAIAVLTLGDQIDTVIDSYMDRGQLMEAYILDAIALKLMQHAYESLVKDVNMDSGLTVSSLEFLGDKYPVELTEDIIHALRPAGISIKEAYMLSPLKSVCLVLPLSQASGISPKAACHICANCANTTCAIRKSNQ